MEHTKQKCFNNFDEKWFNLIFIIFWGAAKSWMIIRFCPHTQNFPLKPTFWYETNMSKLFWLPFTCTLHSDMFKWCIIISSRKIRYCTKRSKSICSIWDVPKMLWRLKKTHPHRDRLHVTWIVLSLGVNQHGYSMQTIVELTFHVRLLI